MRKTYFAPAERIGPDYLTKQIGFFVQNSDDLSIGDALPLIFLILNEQRQVVYANQRVLDCLNLDGLTCVYGKRPGELFNCVHAKGSPGGCGTSENCRNCGAIQAIVKAQSGEKALEECRLTDCEGHSFDFRVTAAPVQRFGERFVLLSLEDIQHEKRREALERTFFHDLLNTAGGLSGLVELLEVSAACGAEQNDILHSIKHASRRLVDEIVSGRALSQAERGSLALKLKALDVVELARQTVAIYENHPLGRSREIRCEFPEESISIVTDGILFQRILENLLKNALEAGPEASGVDVRLRADADGGLHVWVCNEAVMPLPVKQQVFQRSFSTKGEGRGLGTYSVKLFTETYLRGTVQFESEEGKGTVFHVHLPRLEAD